MKIWILTNKNVRYFRDCSHPTIYWGIWALAETFDATSQSWTSWRKIVRHCSQQHLPEKGCMITVRLPDLNLLFNVSSCVKKKHCEQKLEQTMTELFNRMGKRQNTSNLFKFVSSDYCEINPNGQQSFDLFCIDPMNEITACLM